MSGSHDCVSDAVKAWDLAQLGGVPRRPRGTSLGMGLLAPTAVAPPTTVAPPILIWSKGGGTRMFPPEAPDNCLLSESGVLLSPASSGSELAGSSESDSSRRIHEPWSCSSSSSRSEGPMGWVREESLLGSSDWLLTSAAGSGTREGPPDKGHDGKVSGGHP